jgi:hypothetical protein
MQKLVQLTQLRDANHGARGQAHQTTTGPVKHPLRDLQEADILAMLNTAAKDRFVPCSRFADQHLLAVPWMPGINEFADLSIMGFVLSTSSVLFGEVVVLQRNLSPRVNSSRYNLS